MLVLSRREGELIHVDGGITVEILEIRGNRVKLGITAPDETVVWRGEIPRHEFAPAFITSTETLLKTQPVSSLTSPLSRPEEQEQNGSANPE